ncbi:YigZ family protein [Parendozoicomonas haliclonae]|uniref:IMPACT family member YigZ n=1 Tax=Parendozoicomonas haliclonae TaxID=1960125 RepID=A0A1X7AJI4_9GAMM|nr:YigZ family protein [Parendozoicomonas haliclonae]SMA45974.1 IMPACT family member YigZ [Parendozoicomonas haliclonae]
MTRTAYPVPAAPVIFEEIIKKSRFITYLARTTGREEAQAFIQSLKEEHPDARHHCWAFIAGAPNDAQQWGFSDDGEPSGTAGKPILARLEGSGCGEVCAVVVRYYGGIKLGTGGLVRAYGGGAGAAVQQLTTELKVPHDDLQLTCEYDQLNDIQHISGLHGAVLLNTEYGINLQLQLSVPAANMGELKNHLNSHFKGRLVLPED